ncbi:hypothetical protein [Halobacillus sp. H74]|uniref:hypothetical protein n=1 Tax=Halobacillus sp. H74 TaxID=3457436 RepID=UPI003FCC2974
MNKQHDDSQIDSTEIPVPSEVKTSEKHKDLKARLLHETQEYLDIEENRAAFAKLAEIFDTVYSLTEHHGASMTELELMHQKWHKENLKKN